MQCRKLLLIWIVLLCGPWDKAEGILKYFHIIIRDFQKLIMAIYFLGGLTYPKQFSDQEKRFILGYHNEFRKAIAAGNVEGQPPASNMKLLVSHVIYIFLYNQSK